MHIIKKKPLNEPGVYRKVLKEGQECRKWYNYIINSAFLKTEFLLIDRKSTPH